uniref:hypothetical protein n=1 Tax=Ningiella ruwaisensis TaxID=2364274 RepID=UPI0010A04D71|nr:hypothetical protein [Ningiella ruwaisensis]
MTRLQALSSLVIASTLSIALACIPAQAKSNRLISSGLTDLVNELNKQTPLKVDSDTRLDSVATFANYMIYNNTLTDFDAEEVNPQLVAQHFEENVISQLCAMENFRPFIELELVMVYRYTDKNGKFITELSKDLSSCV